MRVAVVGSGGAGMTSAWLLDRHHEVTLYERNEQLGGHAHTTTVERDGHTYYVDDGFAWFSDAMYPTFMRLLELHGVATRIVRMSATFTQTPSNRTFVLPPTTVGSFLRTILDVPGLVALLRLNRAIDLANPVVHGHDKEMSWGEFIRKHGFSEKFCREVLTPMVAGAWGGPYDRTDEFAAYPLMKYYVFHRPSGLSRYHWHVIRDGAASYIRQVARALRNTRLRTSTSVVHLEKTARGWSVRDNTGEVQSFDRVIIATGARDARAILKDVRGIDTVKEVLEGFEYYTAQLATHSDPSFMPPRRRDWRPTNVIWNGSRSHLTVWAGHEHGSDVFTSYVSDRMPTHCHNVSHFSLPLITPAHYKAQERLAAIQGHDNLWFAGDWTRDIGCHEDAVCSAVEVCEKLDPASPRLELLRTPREQLPLLPLPGTSPTAVPDTEPAAA